MTGIREKVETVLGVAIDIKAPFAKFMVDEIMKIVSKEKPTPEQLARALYEHEGKKWDKLPFYGKCAAINSARFTIEVLEKMGML